MPSYITQAMSKINITKDDIGRKFVTKKGDTHTILRIENGGYPVRVSDEFGYTKELKWWNTGQLDLNDFSHWADEAASAEEPAPSLTPWTMTCHSKEPAPPTRTPEWWATFHVVLPKVMERHGIHTYESMVAIATEITNEAHK